MTDKQKRGFELLAEIEAIEKELVDAITSIKAVTKVATERLKIILEEMEKEKQGCS